MPLFANLRSLALFFNAAPAHALGVAPTAVSAARPARYRPTTWMESMGGDRAGLLSPVGAGAPAVPIRDLPRAPTRATPG